ncbi:hypothetical protein PIB30_036988 [Stylosanthes scabra]|uniref:Uncharacterized protein n=1 Tax=Stylosanthes scabra TaxID=79078 RepID=A0ABU6YEB0_9FABA|nr:hypothetical protein [Stylosanthes scabra]
MSSAATATATDSTLEMVKYAMIDIEVLEDMNPSGMSIVYTVPSNLRKMDEEAFTPQLISIGPIHLGKQHLREMQKLKYSYFQVFWKRSSNEEAMNQYKDVLLRNCKRYHPPLQ